MLRGIGSGMEAFKPETDVKRECRLSRSESQRAKGLQYLVSLRGRIIDEAEAAGDGVLICFNGVEGFWSLGLRNSSVYRLANELTGLSSAGDGVLVVLRGFGV